MMAAALLHIPMAPVTHPSADLFLVGCAAALSMVAGLFFLRFWRETRDVLFLGFAIFFLMQAGSDAYEITLRHPNLGNAWVFLMRFSSRIALLAAILWKNTGQARARR